MSIRQVPSTDLRYYLVAYDKNGRENGTDPDGKMTDRIAQAIRDDKPTDVFVMSHGWKGDIPAAIEQYDRWITAMAGCTADRQRIRQLRPSFKPLLVGFHWPSQPWGDEEFGGTGGAFAAPGAPAATAPSIDALIDAYADRIADTPRARAALRTILTGAMNAGPGVTRLPRDVAQAYVELNEEAHMGGAGLEAKPGDDREPFDPDTAYTNAALSASALGPGGMPAFGSFSLSGVLSPLRQLSFWKMKDRARSLGETAGFSLLQGMMNAVPNDRAADVRFHLMGHSFGCIVVTSMIHGPDGSGELRRPVSSLTLVQGATSLWGFCESIPEVNKPGYFRRVISNRKVSGPIITTQSKRDTAVGRFYPIAAGIALQTAFPAGQFPKYGGLGAFGIQGPGVTVHDLSLGGIDHDYQFKPGEVYNLECTGVIKDGTGASGAHSDIAKPEVAHAMWAAVSVQ